MTLSKAAARALLLAAQGLLEPPAAASPEDVLETIRRMGALQIDTISVVARSHTLVLWSRLGSYDPRWLDDLHASGALFEYWSHAICFLPIENYSMYRWRMLERAQGDLYLEAYDPVYKEVILQVLKQIRECGAARSAQFVDAEKQRGGWWNRKPEKIALDHLFDAGLLMIARREAMQRVYDLQERVLPEWDDARALPPEAARRELVLKAILALGVAFPRWIQWYFHDIFRKAGFASELRIILARLVEEGEIAPVCVDGLAKTAYIHRDHLDLVERARAGDLQSSVTTLLSPFDPVVSDRQRASDLFGFDYRIEVYTPAPRRQYGYFTLPILHRGELVGRLDPKAHRKDGLMEIKAIYLEPGVEVIDRLVDSISATLRAFAEWHGTPEVLIRRSEPAELQHRIQDRL